MATTRAAGVTAAAGTGLARPLLTHVIYTYGQPTYDASTRYPLIAVSRSVKFSRLLRPVGPGFMSQNPSPGSCSHNPYPSSASRYITPTTT